LRLVRFRPATAYGLVAALGLAIVLGIFAVQPASAEVTSVGGGAFGIQASVTVPLLPPIVVGPTPSVTLPPVGASPPITANTASATVGTVLSTGVLEVSTQGGTVVSHTRTAQSDATVANLNVLSGLVTAGAVNASCSSNGDGSTGQTTLTGLTGVVGVGVNPAPNTTVAVPGVGTIVFNEQIRTDTPGVSSEITVNAMHITFAVPLIVTGDVIISQAHCLATGPDVLAAPTTTVAPTTTAAPTTTVAPPTTSGGGGGGGGGGGSLPSTGTNPWPLLGTGVGLLGLGGFTLRATRLRARVH
jgi:hypothetical protein